MGQKRNPADRPWLLWTRTIRHRLNGSWLLIGALTLTIAACGGGNTKRITGADKDKLSQAALELGTECRLNGASADTSAVEDSVNTLLNLRDEFGDQRFTISDTFKDVTVQDILDDRVKMMEQAGCAPDQAKRMH
jgi:molecular chaperone DnaK (HSP70)